MFMFMSGHVSEQNLALKSTAVYSNTWSNFTTWFRCCLLPKMSATTTVAWHLGLYR